MDGNYEFIFQAASGRVSQYIACPPVDLYLISEKSILKNQIQRTGFLVYFELDFYCLRSLQKSISKLHIRTIFGNFWNIQLNLKPPP